jgi:hypothetical protein
VDAVLSQIASILILIKKALRDLLLLTSMETMWLFVALLVVDRTKMVWLSMPGR